MPAGQKWPPGQAWQAAAPGPFAKVPAAQMVHDVAPPALELPAPHGRHAALELLPGAALKRPAAQRRQAEELAAPCVALKVPAGHAAQAVLEGALQKPSGQHAPAPALLLSPAPHGRHDALEALPGAGL